MGTVVRPTLFLLHALGMSAREWDGVTSALGDEFDCVPLDLPGFGDAAADPRVSVEEMADWLADEVRRRDPVVWMPIGHSMGGKIATIVAARARDGEEGLSGIAGIILLAASPPSPEPIDDDRRREMIAWATDRPIAPNHAAQFVDDNSTAEFGERARRQAIADVERCGRQAWLAWLERGSREDWSAFVGTIDVPALVVAGAEDGDLGEANQRGLNAPHYRDCRIETIARAAHLLPYERPREVAALIADHWDRVRGRVLPPLFARVLASPRVSRRTRAAMLARIGVPDGRCLTDAQRETLVALTQMILPGVGGDIATRIEASLAAGDSDGWRFADLPADVDAFRLGLDALTGFAGLAGHEQQECLVALDAGHAAAGSFDGRQMERWFEDLRAAAVRAWLSQPAAMARIGWDGFANGGDGARRQGYQRTAADDLEPWQPRTAAR